MSDGDLEGQDGARDTPDKKPRRRGETIRAVGMAMEEEGPFDRSYEVTDAPIAEEKTPIGVASVPGGGAGDGGGGDGRSLLIRSEAVAIPRSSGLTPDQLTALRPHIVDLSQGRFSTDGEIKSTRSDVDAIFDQHIPAAIREAQGPLRIVFYAHGGLVSETNGLLLAENHVNWWKANGVYPIYFIWETGFLETVRDLLTRSGPRGLVASRDIFDFTTDPLIEAAARALGGPRIWGDMKNSAERSVDRSNDPDRRGGARYVAERLLDLCNTHGDQIELHAVGHSAGSIFHAYFLPTALDLGVPAFQTLHFLAPAIRVDTFQETLQSRIGNGIGHLSIFTMFRDRELADNCAHIYNKSLLYLIYYALEAERKTPLLGLEISLRENPKLRQLFGLDGSGQASPGEVIFSVSATAFGRSASTSTSHGGFDDDPPTMNSVLRRVLGRGDSDALALEFPQPRSVEDLLSWENQVDFPDVSVYLRPGLFPAAATATATAGPEARASAVVLTPDSRPAGTRRRALCVGIDAYPKSALQGCVNDARLWQRTLEGLDFTTTLLTDARATREAILAHLLALVQDSSAGDVIVFQYSGHGTSVPDESGDEIDGLDEAFCPVDVFEGALLLDDDIGSMIFDRIPDGVNMTCFVDCCHSGTIARVAQIAHAAARSTGDLPRLLPMTPELLAAHKAYRARRGMQPRAMRARALPLRRELVFSACRADELAWESAGQGDFTRNAAGQLGAAVQRGVTNNEFEQQMLKALSVPGRQQPQIDGAPESFSRTLLRSLRSAPVPAPAASVASSSDSKPSDLALLAKALEDIAAALRQRGQ